MPGPFTAGPGGGNEKSGMSPARGQTAFLIVGGLAIFAGGCLSAAGGEAPSRHLSWASAYLVLVWGLAQVFLGGIQPLVTSSALSGRLVTAQLAAFNLGNAAVLAGTLSRIPAALGAGSAFLLASLALFAWATRSSERNRRLLVVVNRLVLVALAVSVPVGAALAH
ncbi:MAG: hypothetical protein ACRDWN_07605 [Acidimicrobiales bacterium]